MGLLSDQSDPGSQRATTNPLARQLRAVLMSLPKLWVCRRVPVQEQFMELIAAWPEWLVWCAAGAIGAFALASLARMLLAAFDLDAG